VQWWGVVVLLYGSGVVVLLYGSGVVVLLYGSGVVVLLYGSGVAVCDSVSLGGTLTYVSTHRTAFILRIKFK
jgi:hypothetical protein